MQEITCPFCDTPAEKIVIQERGYKGRQCPSCQLIYISPRPSLADVAVLYDASRNKRPQKSRFGLVGNVLTARHHLRIVREFTRTGQILMLEIGPGEGDFLYAAREQGFDAYGVELDPLRADFIRQRLGIPCEHSSLDTSVFAGNEFDVIYHRNVLSHFYDPISEFKKINSRLRPGGIHVFETGNWGDVERRYFKSTNSFHYPNHLFFFSSTSLRQLLFRTGFELVAIYRFCKLPELILRKILEHPVPSGLASVSTTRNGDSEPISGLKRIVADVVSCIMYFITYKLGHVLLKKQSLPQTMILVTRKTGYGEKV